MLKTIRAAVACLILSSLLAYPEAKTAIAIASGEVSVNGSSVKRSTSVFEGDRLRTGSNGGVLLHLRGATVQLAENSDVQYDGERLSLLAGSAVVRGTETLISGPFVIAPSGDGQFHIERTGIVTKLSIVSGKVKVTKGKKSLLLSGEGERSFSDQDEIGVVAKAAVSKDIAAGAAGGAAGAAVSKWMAAGSKSKCISHQSPSGDRCR